MQRHLLPVILFSSAYLLGALAWVLAQGNYEFLAYIVIVLILAAAVVAVNASVQLPIALLWCLSFWGLLHMAGGLVPVPEAWPVGGDTHVLYNLWLIDGGLKYDQAVHAFGFGITTWLCWECLKSMLAARGLPVIPTFGKLVLCAAAGMGFGALNEVIEFVITLIVPENNVGGYVNTGLDLVSNMVGAVVAAVLIRWRYSRNARTP
jgi:hypothetical protein